MKNIFKIVIAVIMVTGLWSCESEDNFMLVEAPAAEFLINTPETGTSVVLTDATPDNTALTLTWEAVDYGTPTSITYTVQFALNGTEFAEPIDIASSGARNFSMTVAELNTKAAEMELEPEVQSAIDIRIKATVGSTGSEPKYSNAITLNVTPYQGFIPLQDLYLVGDATEAGWNNAPNNHAMYRDPANQFKFYYTGYFKAGGLKVLSALGSWHPQYGSVSANVLGVSNPDGSGEPGQISVGAAGYYTFAIDIKLMTYSLDAYDASAAPSFTSVGIIGDGTPGGWGDDTNLTNSTDNPHIWKGSVELTTAKVKFRANDSWDLPGNWGGGTPVSGTVSVNGGDFQAVLLGGTYTIWFNDLDGRYIFIKE